ncbi:hypothetical protein PT974_04178 [Cladobotryum mycophilum]|uniref:Uncharacterized protein n=1 Tax=Cladobotryum mycophilum TaxID=491253 RepID=A0ABR0SVG1_9HYPO
MFGTLSGLVNLAPQNRLAPEDIPPPTPISLPRYQPFAQDDDASLNPQDALSNLLKSTGRSTAALGPIGLSAIGFDLKLDAETKDLIPDPSYIPDFGQWDRLTPDEARDQNNSARRLLRNGNLSPGCQVYLERYKELSHGNEDAFRTVRRIPPPKGKQQARLGNAYEFFRCLELFTTYWDDPTQPPALPPSPEISASEKKEPSEGAQTQTDGVGKEPPKFMVIRTAEGSAMPPEFRINLITAFVKLVSYDFGCNVSMARVEPRLHFSSPEDHPHPRKSHIASNCHFVFQSPTSRETARAGLVYGPVATVSARPTVSFTTPNVETAQSLDLAREVLAALIAAQHRAREGKTEKRFGEGEWWTSKPRWGGGPGGPIGREIERDATQGDKDVKPEEGAKVMQRLAKRPRKNVPIYDNYRMVRAPSYTWDRKARYEAIGKQKGADFDDIFVISSLFHHMSIIRIRVPNRLLEVLDGSPDPDTSRRSWGKVQAWRSRWYDLFETDQRLAAMQLIWAMISYQMRGEAVGEDINMADG